MNILWLKTGPLHPLDSGGKLRTFHMLRELKERHHVTYLSLRSAECRPSELEQAGDYAHECIWCLHDPPPKPSLRFLASVGLNLALSRLPLAVARYHSKGFARRLAELDQSGRFDLIICDFLFPAVNLGKAPLHTPSLLFQHNVESRIWRRLRDNEPNRLKRALFQVQHRRMQTFEGRVSRHFTGVVGVSESDCRQMRADFGLENVLGPVSTGVDTAYFQPTETEPTEPRIGFLGSMDWMANQDSVRWFVQAIWPAILEGCPQARFRIIGKNPPESIRALPQAHPAIEVTGTVPDVRPHLAECQVLVVPLRVGGGTRIKIYEAMAAGVPVISTQVGAEGLTLESGVHILLADSPEEFSRTVIDLLSDASRRAALRSSARQWVARHFSWNQVTRTFEDYCRSVITHNE